MTAPKFTLNESTVEYATASSFGTMHFPCLRGVEIDDGGERTGIVKVD